jgi:hypothetical protein
MKAKTVLFLILWVSLGCSLSAQKYGTTDDGLRVILKDNGTWDTLRVSEEVPEGGPITLAKPSSSKQSIKGEQIDYTIWFNPGKWKVLDKTLNSFADYTLQHRDGDVMAIIIAERIEVKLDKLIEIAINNAKNAGTDFRIMDWREATINGLEGKMLKFTTRVQDIDFTYLSFYYSSEKGSFQFITFTSNNLFTKYEKDLMDLIGGFRLN